MKYLGRTLALLALVALVAGFVCYRMSQAPAVHAAIKTGDALTWLRADFQLDDHQFAAIKKLHEAYAPTCDEHCRLIREAVAARNALKAREGADPVAVAAAEQALQELRSTCESAIVTHVRQVAALMSPRQGERYLALVLPKIANFDHQSAPDLALQHAPRP
ncbi:MAG TPA: periplasmic heavy metal sensor [Candidatus Didemnitutus sp.]|nr:periplasmic heavy metal sensor [Candidatus Didemnitutus sp.]